MDSLAYSSIKNSISESEWKYNFPDYTDLDKIIENTTIKRVCCMNKGKSGMEGKTEYTVRVRIPLPNGVNSTELQRKYNYFDKEVKIPASICDLPEYSGYSYEGNSGDTKCDSFYKVYCENIINDYKKMTGADKDPSKFNYEEFSKFKPECSCFVPPMEGLTREQAMIPQCWYAQCATSPYRPTNLRNPCQLNIQNCIQNVTNKIGSINSSELQIKRAELVNNCSQNISNQQTTNNNGNQSETSDLKSAKQEIQNVTNELGLPKSANVTDPANNVVKKEEKKEEKKEDKKEENKSTITKIFDAITPKKEDEKDNNVNNDDDDNENKQVEEVSFISRNMKVIIIVIVIAIILFFLYSKFKSNNNVNRYYQPRYNYS